MSKRKIVFLIGGGLAVLVAVTLLVIILVKINKPQPLQPPELGGQRVPSKVFEISFEKRYDLFCGFFKEEPTMFRNCKILGFTGYEEQETGSGGGLSSGGKVTRTHFRHEINTPPAPFLIPACPGSKWASPLEYLMQDHG